MKFIGDPTLYLLLFDTGNVSVVSITRNRSLVDEAMNFLQNSESYQTVNLTDLSSEKIKKTCNSFKDALENIYDLSFDASGEDRFIIKLLSRCNYVKPLIKNTKEKYVTNMFRHLFQSVDGEHTVIVRVIRGYILIENVYSHFYKNGCPVYLIKDHDITFVWNDSLTDTSIVTMKTISMLDSKDGYLCNIRFNNTTQKLKNVRVVFPDIDKLLQASTYDCLDGLPFHCHCYLNLGYHDMMEVEHTNVEIIEPWDDTKHKDLISEFSDS